MAAVGPPARQWLFGPVPDMLLGCGGLYALGFVLFGVDAGLRSDLGPALFPVLVLLLTMPHYGATILRVYEHRKDRRSYALFSIWATLGVLGCFVAGLESPYVASVLLTVFLTWSPWHYTGQNYGLAVMFLRRGSVPLAPVVKRLLYASFLLSYAMVVLANHAATPSVDYVLVAPGDNVQFLPLGIPYEVSRGLAVPVGLAYLVCLSAAIVLLSRVASLRTLLPSGLLVLTQAIWFGIPFALRFGGITTGFAPLDWDQRSYFVEWIALGHAAQYLWITSYYARSSDGWTGFSRYLLKTLAAGKALSTVPILIVGSLGVGVLAYDTGLSLLVISVINIHHFMLDGAIWKLRNSRVGGILIRSVPEEEIGAEDSHTAVASWARRGVWGVAGAALAVGVFVLWNETFLLPAAVKRGDVATATHIFDRIGWFGFDHSQVRLRLGLELERNGQADEALHHLERSVARAPSVEGYSAIGRLYEERGDLARALDAYALALALDSSHVPSRRGLERSRRLVGAPPGE